MSVLRIYSANFPYGFGESFFLNEYPYLHDKFQKVYIHPYAKLKSRQNNFEFWDNVDFIEQDNRQKSSFKSFIFICRLYLEELRHSQNKRHFLKHALLHLSTLKKAYNMGNTLLEKGLKKDDLCYSFWMNDWALTLAILKRRGKINKFVFRVNGFDIWNDRNPGNYIPFRHFIYAQCNKVYALSNTSAEYLKRLEIFPDKIQTAYFGTRDFGMIEKSQDSKFVIFSNSSAIPIKRLDKIAQSITELNFPVHWHHHGEGETLTTVRDIISSSKNNNIIEFTNSNKVSNYEEVIELMKKMSPDLFINLSSTEGLPVSAIEALSCGIPLLLNDVGSCSELITPNTGVLVKKDSSVLDIAKVIVNFKEENFAYKNQSKIREFWKNQFSANKNYSEFVDELKEIYESKK
ncbi:glycosyltransferase [Paracrocinitomix mangrovi]|uniref:glycosyltransferase n=1 Tax=Paracrocinitomix mangrovi TaxID=2862509 RepID=UPI001C8EBB6C|nr:glycosyltransferase [Paracrocinitomix mangrovi]UKN01564.1 glycosyltransferase [Paracrocinitomix mangrovi]